MVGRPRPSEHPSSIRCTALRWFGLFWYSGDHVESHLRRRRCERERAVESFPVRFCCQPKVSSGTWHGTAKYRIASLIISLRSETNSLGKWRSTFLTRGALFGNDAFVVEYQPCSPHFLCRELGVVKRRGLHHSINCEPASRPCTPFSALVDSAASPSVFGH